MAKQQKKSAARRVPRASEPRMYGDGKPSEPADEQQSAAIAERPAVAQRAPVSTAGRVPAPRTAPRSSGVTPRGAGSTGSFGRVDRITDYTYVMHDLRRLGIVAAGILATLVVLGIVIR